MQKSILYISTLLLVLSSCVTPKIHNALVIEHDATKSALTTQEKKVLQLNGTIEEQEGTIISLKSQISEMRNDSVQNGIALTTLQSKYDALSDAYDLLTSKEDELKLAQEELDARSARVTELETIINKKDSIVTALKSSISKALIGLEGEGLTVIQKNGKVYISLEEDLLFASGKYEVNSGGVSALSKLATALASQKDLEILVEGHTDSIPLSGRGLVKDNWDLSVMRATNVVKVLLKTPSLDPLQLTAAGRAEFVPIATNKIKEGRSANRRIEMILSPNLDDLFELLKE